MRLRFARLSLLVKILLSTSCAVTLLFGITMLIMVDNISGVLSGNLEKEEVRNSFQVYQSLLQSRLELLRPVSDFVSEMKEVRSATGIGGKTSVEDEAGKLWSRISGESAIFLVTDSEGKVLESWGGVSSPLPAEDIEFVPKVVAKYPAHIEHARDVAKLQDSGFFFQKGEPGELYQIVVTPVYLDSVQGQDLDKVLVPGYRVDALVAGELKDATGSDFLLEASGGLAASILNPRDARLAHANGLRGKDAGADDYAKGCQPLQDIFGARVAELCAMRSFDDVERRIAKLSTPTFSLWLAAMCVGLGLTYLLARHIVEPVKQLDRAASEVACGDFPIEVPVGSEDEIGRLAQTFDTMCASIRDAREELIRQESISMIGRLSSSIVHDLRNPLAAIYTSAEMLVYGNLPPAHVKRLAANIYHASQRIQKMLQDLLDTSRGKPGALETCRLAEIGRAACESMSATAELHGVTINVAIASEIELTLERSRMERAFVNLIGNAIEAMPDGGEVRVSAQLDADFVVAHVDDTGPGVAMEIRSTLFQPFVTAGKRNGLGLGLALTRQTLIEHGGDLWVDDSPYGGARFSLRLPGAYVAEPLALATAG